MTSFTLLLSKKIYPLKNLPAIFTNSKQSKNLFGRNSGTYGIPCHAKGQFVFYYHHVTYRTSCHASGHLVIFTLSATDLRGHFLFSGVFYLTLLPASFKVSLRPVVNLNISRVSCWYFWNIAQARLFVWITTIHKRVYNGTTIYALWPAVHVNNLLFTRFELSSSQVKHIKSLMFYPFSHRAIQSTLNFLIVIRLKLLAKILGSAYDFAVNIVMSINITNNKTHDIHDSIHAAITYDFAVNLLWW